MEEFTPTEELVLEVLVSRHRLGETIWTFTNNSTVKKALNGLHAAGLVTIIDGTIERTVRAGLTSLAKDRFLSTKYKARALQEARIEGIEMLALAATAHGFITLPDIQRIKNAVREI